MRIMVRGIFHLVEASRILYALPQYGRLIHLRSAAAACPGRDPQAKVPEV